MASLLAAQLSKIAANSTNSFNLKAQKAAHAKSLIFEPRVAASQSYDTIYTLCHEGFQELCLLDGRYGEFQRSLFSEQSQEQDRTQMTADQNAELDLRLESFLGLVGARLRLSPAIKAVEWLVRRFRIHEYNTAFLLTTFLPYHTLPIFTTLLSIIPSNIPHTYHFLHPYIRSLKSPTRHSVVHTATNNFNFASLLNSYVLKICNARQSYPWLLSFWAGIMTEALSGMLDRSRSGRKGVEIQNEESVILRLLPFLNEGLAMKKVSDLRIGCYMLLSIMASKGNLDDNFLTAMMEAIVLGWSSDTFLPGLVCLSILAQQRGAKKLTKRLTKGLLKINDLDKLLVEISKDRRVDKLANGLCLSLIDRVGKNGDVTVLPLVEHIVKHDLLSKAQLSVTFKSLLLLAHKLDDTEDPEGSARSGLATTLTTLAATPGQIGMAIQGTIKESDIDIDELEMKLKTAIRPKALPATTDHDDSMMDIEVSTKAKELVPFETMFSQRPEKEEDVTSFLSHTKFGLYNRLLETFLVSIEGSDYLSKVSGSSILRPEAAPDAALDEPLYFSFFLRTWCGPHPVLARAAALHAVTQQLEKLKPSSIDFQVMVPYIIVALGDSAMKVRKAATQLVELLGSFYPADMDKAKPQFKRWAKDLYGSEKGAKSISWISADEARRLIQDVLGAGLEECILDENHVDSMFEKMLNKPKEHPNDSSTTSTGRFSQAFRSNVLLCLSSHVVNTPIFSTKLRLLKILNRVRGIANTSRTKPLLPVLQDWAKMSSAEVLDICQSEGIDAETYDQAVAAVVVPNDTEGFDALATIVKSGNNFGRKTLIAAIFLHFRDMWRFLKPEMRLKAAQLLLEIGLWPKDKAGPSEQAQSEAMEILRSVPLSTDILQSFLDQLPTAAKLIDKPPATKRRRVSHGEVARMNILDSKELDAAVRKTTFVLQLLDSSSPQKHVSLLRGLFNALAELQHFKAHVGSELGYLQGLILSSLLAIMKIYRQDASLQLDRSAVRPDLLVDCVQKTTSPQVQNAALLLISSLAVIAPELVLHSVMPIFTFMGSSVLRQNDEYSAHVIKQTVTEVITPLIASLRKKKSNPVTGAAELLLSFIAAYEHVPAHRKKGLFVSLITTLGPEDFLFALLAMLVNKYGTTDNIQIFAVELSGSFSAEVQLLTALKYIGLVSDLLKPKRTISNTLLGSTDSTSMNPPRTAVDLLTFLPVLLSQQGLKDQTGKLLEQDDMSASKVRDLYSLLLEHLLDLAEKTKNENQLQSVCGDVLESLLGLLNTDDFIKSVEGLLDRPNDDLRRKILRAVEVRVDQHSQSDATSRQAFLNFLPQVTAIIRESQDAVYKQIAVSCVDKISAKYGKKDIEAVAAAAEAIASEQCLGQNNDRLQVMALLCLASLAEILHDGIVPVLPIAIGKALEYLDRSVEKDKVNENLHNAAYAFITALVQYLPYMVSGAYLDNLLLISNKSAEADIDEEADENRVQCLKFAAKQIEGKTMFAALEKDWQHASAAGSLALREYLDVLSIAIDKHPKSVIARNSNVLSNIFISAFDLRRTWLSGAAGLGSLEEISQVEGLINAVGLKMIYKLNDTTFRPIFTKIVESAVSGLPKREKRGRMLRLESLYSFMAVFFSNLKSIVTSYATYLLEPTVDILKSVNVKDDDSKELWSRVLLALTEMFKHDQDDFWQSPAHFNAMMPVLEQQFLNASSLPVIEQVVPAVVELVSVADSADHHKDLNGRLLRLLRSETSSVRLAAIKCQQALTDRLGEEWLSLLPEMLPVISELQEDDDDVVERETQRWIVKIEGVLGESLDSMLQ